MSRLYNLCANKNALLKFIGEICEMVSVYGTNSKEFMTMVGQLLSDMNDYVRNFFRKVHLLIILMQVS